MLCISHAHMHIDDLTACPPMGEVHGEVQRGSPWKSPVGGGCPACTCWYMSLSYSFRFFVVDRFMPAGTVTPLAFFCLSMPRLSQVPLMQAYLAWLFQKIFTNWKSMAKSAKMRRRLGPIVSAVACIIVPPAVNARTFCMTHILAIDRQMHFCLE